MWSRHRHRYGLGAGQSGVDGGPVTRLTSLQRGYVITRHYDPVRYGVKPDHLKHFWPCDEEEFTPGVNSAFMFELIEGGLLNIPAVRGVPTALVYPYCDQYHTMLDSGARDLGAPETFDCFADQDWIVLVAFKGRSESCSEFTTGRPTSGAEPVRPESIFLKLQPYYFAINFDGTFQTQPWGYLHTKQRTAVTVTRNVGQDYMVAFVRRGDYIQHWVDGVLQGENQISKLLLAAGRTYGDRCIEAAAMIPKMRPAKRVRLGHSGTGLMNQSLKTDNPDYDYPHMVDGDTAAYVETPAGFGNDGKQVVNEPTQYCGITINSWPEGSLDFPDIADFMNWHKTRWFAGNKRVDYAP